MRLIQATVPSDAESDVCRVLGERGEDYYLADETATSEYESLLYVPVENEDVEEVLSALRDAGLDESDHIVVIDTEVDIYGESSGSAMPEQDHGRIAAAELRGKTDELLPDMRTYVVMLMLSSLVATTGLLLDSAAVVVGAMVIAPLFGPAVSTSIGTVMDDNGLFKVGVKFQVIGVAAAIVTATAFAFLLRITFLVPTGMSITTAPQIAARLSPDVLSLVVAFSAGVAGVLSIATGSGVALVGVMMAAALLPPAATVGIGIVWGNQVVAFNSGLLLLVNLLAINLAGHATLWYLGYRPQTWVEIKQTRQELLRRAGVLLLAVVVTSAFLVNATYADAQRSQLEDAIETDIGTLLDQPQYSNVTLLNVKIEQNQPALAPDTDRVVVTIGRPPGRSYPRLHAQINENVTRIVERDIPVAVRVSLVLSESMSQPSVETSGAGGDATNRTTSPSGRSPTVTASPGAGNATATADPAAVRRSRAAGG